jgi:hypothetical protein
LVQREEQSLKANISNMPFMGDSTKRLTMGKIFFSNNFNTRWDYDFSQISSSEGTFLKSWQFAASFEHHIAERTSTKAAFSNNFNTSWNYHFYDFFQTGTIRMSFFEKGGFLMRLRPLSSQQLAVLIP